MVQEQEGIRSRAVYGRTQSPTCSCGWPEQLSWGPYNVDANRVIARALHFEGFEPRSASKACHLHGGCKERQSVGHPAHQYVLDPLAAQQSEGSRSAVARDVAERNGEKPITMLEEPRGVSTGVLARGGSLVSCRTTLMRRRVFSQLVQRMRMSDDGLSAKTSRLHMYRSTLPAQVVCSALRTVVGSVHGAHAQL